MRSKIFKPALLLLMALLVVNSVGFAQDISISVDVQNPSVSVKTNFNDKDFQAKMNDLNKELKAGLKDFGKNLSLSLNGISPKINLDLNNLGDDINIDVNPKIDLKFNVDGDGINSSDNDMEDGNRSQKSKSYSKTYPIDGNDKIKLSNQYGKITVNTWDRHEVKVDVQIMAQAKDDDDAQKLLDGVQINDSKNGDLVSFKTEIQNNNGSWKIWNWGSNKQHKLQIDYTVYMPAKTDLNIEDSYGSIELPNLDGRIKLSTSYGSASIQNLSNPSNDLEGSYGSLKAGSVNGGRLNFSYGSVDMDECNNLKADLSYGSFKLGKLKGAGDFDLSYEGGFKIDELENSFKRLNVNTSYSGLTLGIAGNNNFDFDITTNYGGFNYDDSKITFTSKTPPDGSSHIGTSRNYKGHFGKGNGDVKVTVHTSYGGVNFE
jgi:hypothetical protein